MQYYTCDVCKEKVERDLMVFMKHTDEHIVEEIRKKHPEWVEENGLCRKCYDYYKKAMGR